MHFTAEQNRKGARMYAYLYEHLRQCATELRQWGDTVVNPRMDPMNARWTDEATYPMPHLRELVRLCDFLTGANPFAVAKELIVHELLENFLNTAEDKKPFSAVGYAQKQREIATAHTETLREDSQWRFELWFHDGETAFHELTPYGIAHAAWEASRTALATQVDEALAEFEEAHVS